VSPFKGSKERGLLSEILLQKADDKKMNLTKRNPFLAFLYFIIQNGSAFQIQELTYAWIETKLCLKLKKQGKYCILGLTLFLVILLSKKYQID